jgi:hypothetical protein
MVVVTAMIIGLGAYVALNGIALTESPKAAGTSSSTGSSVSSILSYTNTTFLYGCTVVSTTYTSATAFVPTTQTYTLTGNTESGSTITLTATTYTFSGSGTYDCTTFGPMALAVSGATYVFAGTTVSGKTYTVTFSLSYTETITVTTTYTTTA